MPVVPGSMENGSNDHDFLFLIHFVDHPVGKAVGVAPANILRSRQ